MRSARGRESAGVKDESRGAGGEERGWRKDEDACPRSVCHAGTARTTENGSLKAQVICDRMSRD